MKILRYRRRELETTVSFKERFWTRQKELSIRSRWVHERFKTSDKVRTLLYMIGMVAVLFMAETTIAYATKVMMTLYLIPSLSSR